MPGAHQSCRRLAGGGAAHGPVDGPGVGARPVAVQTTFGTARSRIGADGSLGYDGSKQPRRELSQLGALTLGQGHMPGHGGVLELLNHIGEPVG